MRHLSLLVCAGLITLASFAACGSDDGAKKVRGDAGAGGSDAGGGGDPSSGGSSSPAAGEGGVPGVAGQGGAGAGAPPLATAGEGGSGGVAPSAGAAGEGGEPPACPAEPGSFTHSCGEITELFSPTFDTDTSEMSLTIPGLAYPIASGTVSFFYENVDAVQCGSTDLVEGMDTSVTANLNLLFTPGKIRISAFDLVDTCGSHHVFDQTGVPTCYELIASGGAGSLPLSCEGTFNATCPEPCE